MVKISIAEKRYPNLRLLIMLMLCALIPLMTSSCGGGNAAQRKSFARGLEWEIGYAIPDDLIFEMGPPQETAETPEGTWYTWRRVTSGAVSGGVSVGFFSMSLGAPVESGEELSCFFDRDTGRLSTYTYREW